MKPSIKNLTIDLESLTCRDTSYVTHSHVDSGATSRFFVASGMAELRDVCINETEGVVPEFLVSDSEELVSEETKFLIYVNDRFYHFLADSLTLILKFHRLKPDMHFVLYLNVTSGSKNAEWMYESLFDLLDLMGVRYTKIPTVYEKHYSPVYRISNYISTDDKVFHIHETVNLLDVGYAVDTLVARSMMRQMEREEKPVNRYGAIPFRKVYLSRSGFSGVLGSVVDDGSGGYLDDKRMDDEQKLDEFFLDAGFEVVTSETKFSNFIEQIIYMSEVKTLVGLTGSGLTNMLFMPPGGTVVELEAELVVPSGMTDDGMSLTTNQELHLLYQPLSFLRQHLHVLVPTRRDPNKVIEMFKGNGALAYLLTTD